MRLFTFTRHKVQETWNKKEKTGFLTFPFSTTKYMKCINKFCLKFSLFPHFSFEPIVTMAVSLGKIL